VLFVIFDKVTSSTILRNRRCLARRKIPFLFATCQTGIDNSRLPEIVAATPPPTPLPGSPAPQSPFGSWRAPRLRHQQDRFRYSWSFHKSKFAQIAILSFFIYFFRTEHYYHYLPKCVTLYCCNPNSDNYAFVTFLYVKILVRFLWPVTVKLPSSLSDPNKAFLFQHRFFIPYLCDTLILGQSFLTIFAILCTLKWFLAFIKYLSNLKILFLLLNWARRFKMIFGFFPCWKICKVIAVKIYCVFNM
jgi:hypothetical protein